MKRDKGRDMIVIRAPQHQFGTSKKRRVIGGDRGGGCVHANSGKRELYLNPNPWRVLMQGQERVDGRGRRVARGWSGWVLASTTTSVMD
jgi:hypothetical protein